MNFNTRSSHLFFLILFVIIFAGCKTKTSNATTSVSWENRFKDELNLLGHRNWILVVDKAFPLQNGDGINVIYTGEPLLPTLKIVMDEVNAASHVRPVVYTDREMHYLSDDDVKGINSYKRELAEIIGSSSLTILHDTVFTKIKEASALFSILVLKTTEVIPYSSVFLELDCAYWSPEEEAEMRERMK